MATHKVTMAVLGSGIELSKDISYTNTGVALIDGETLATASDDEEMAFTLDFSACKAFYLVSDQDITFDTNAADPGHDDQISLLANEPYVWHETSYHTFLIGTDITSVFISNNSGSTATIYCLALSDPTP